MPRTLYEAAVDAMTRLLLAGGGHSHIFVLRELARRRPPELDVVLVTPHERQLYSGMLPGWIAGHYALDELAIPLEPLVRAAGARLVRDEIAAIDPETRQATTLSGASISFDLASLATGAAVDLAALPGASEHALAVRPLESFVARWQLLAPQLAARDQPRITVIGAGAGGIEIALAIAYRLSRTRAACHPHLQLIGLGPPLPGHGAGVRRRVERALLAADVTVNDAEVLRVEPSGVRLRDRILPSDLTLVVTGAAPPAWVAASRLATDARGFVAVAAGLRSISHPWVFAAGDVASMAGAPRPKSGVYAVRAGPPQARNQIAAANGAAVTDYAPQRMALYLLATGPKYAIASWGPIAAEGRWVWRWKDRIDRGFIAQFRPRNLAKSEAS
jgi:pyridine nucleotide-disulfide oxidoreductase family protein